MYRQSGGAVLLVHDVPRESGALKGHVVSDFNALGLDPALVRSLEQAGISQPTEIQSKAVPLALEGHDIMGLAQTGTGKTLAFGLPMLHSLLQATGKPEPKTVKALVLAPTRELVNQISDNLRPLVAGSPIRVFNVVGGVSISKQVKNLARGTDILVSTPGRLIDLLERRALDLSTARYLVLDEADQMLDLGFIHALRKIAPHLGTPRQTMLFSATMPKQMEEISSKYLIDPKRVQVAAPGKTADKIEQSVEFLPKGDKPARLREVLSEQSDGLSLVFMRTKYSAERMMKQLCERGFAADSVHGNKSQGQRDRAIKGFRDGTVKVLVATDVAARGIDIPGVAQVINYDLPNVPESYVHRIGRTARAGRDGIAISFCSSEERAYLRDIEKLIGRRFFPEGIAAELDAADEKQAPRKGGGGAGKSRRRRPGKPGGHGGGKPRSHEGGHKPAKRTDGQRKSSPRRTSGKSRPKQSQPAA